MRNLKHLQNVVKSGFDNCGLLILFSFCVLAVCVPSNLVLGSETHYLNAEEETTLSGKVLDNERLIPVAAKLVVKDLLTHAEVSVYFCEKETGEYIFVLPPGRYIIIVEAQGYYYFSEHIEIKAGIPAVEKNLYIEPIEGVISEVVANDNEVEPVEEEVIIEEVATETEPPKDNTSELETVEESIEEEGVEPLLVIDEDINDNGVTDNINDEMVPVAEEEGEEEGEEEKGKEGTMIGEPIRFELNSSTLTSASLLDLNSYADMINDDKKMLVEVGGHTDSTTDNNHDYTISVERAKVVFNKLVDNFVDRNRLKITGYSASQPIGSNSDESGRAINQRVELKIIGYEEEKKEVVIVQPEEEEVREPEIISLVDAVEEINGIHIFFRKKKTKIVEAHHLLLDSLCYYLKTYSNLELEITGYTDTKMSTKKSKKVSERRTLAVVKYINHKGIRKNRLQWRWLGKGNPIATNSTKEGRARNNRVDFEIIGIEGKIEAGGTDVTIVPEEEEPAVDPVQLMDPDDLYFEILELYGKVKVKDLIFNIQVGAFVNELADDAELFSLVNNIETVEYPDGIIRYTTGKFRTLAAANDSRVAIIESGVEDAFVISFYEGVRLTIYELAKLLEENSGN